MEQTATRTLTYSIDTNHATVHFWVRHMMVAKVHGQVAGVTGTVKVDPAHPEASEVEVTIDANTLTTRNEQRDGHLKSPDFLDVEKYPSITYRSTSVVARGENLYTVQGDLTVHGITKPVSLEVETTPEVKGHFGGYVIGITATAVVNREDFGMTWNQALEAGGVLVGKEIHLQIDAELDRPE